MIKRLINSRKKRYMLSGILTFTLKYLINYLLVLTTNKILLSYYLAILFMTIITYFISSWFIFNKDIHVKTFISYIISNIFFYILDVGLYSTLIKINIIYHFAIIISTIIIFIIKFLIYNKIIFKKIAPWKKKLFF